MREGKGRKRDMAYLRPQLAPPPLAPPLTHTLGQSSRSNSAEREGNTFSRPTRPTKRVVDVAVR